MVFIIRTYIPKNIFCFKNMHNIIINFIKPIIMSNISEEISEMLIISILLELIILPEDNFFPNSSSN